MDAARRLGVRVLLSAIGALLAFAAPAAAQTQLPDLVADPALFPELQAYSDADGTRLLLRFDGFVHNKGAGALEIRGSGNQSGSMASVVQRVFSAGGTWADQAAPGATLRFENGDGHNHWHLGAAARYSLWNEGKTAEVAPSQKVGFCFQDSEQREGHGPDQPVYSNDGQNFCEKNKPTVGTVYMGISAGWRDIYQRVLAFQWVDVSDVSPGRYLLRTDVDPNDVVDESNEANTPSYMGQVNVIPGHVAKAVVGPQNLEQGEPAELTLGATTFAQPPPLPAPGPVQYRIASAPQHGTLDVAAGSWFTGPKVTYTPDPGYSGQDSFSYSARDSSSAFPRSPAVATVAVGVQRTKAESVAISGAPAELLTGNGAQLQAKVVNGPPQVTWSVEGVTGGNATVGTITPGGLYTAPAAVPPGGTVTIRADGSFGGFAEAEVRIVKPKPPEPAPEPPPPPPPGDDHPHDPGTGPHTHNPEPPPPVVTPPPVLPPLLSLPQVALNGRRAYVKTIPGQAGVVETKALVGNRRIALCRSSVPASRGAVCKLWVPRRYRLSSVTVVVKLRVAGRAVATRRALLPVAHGAARRPR